MKRLSLLRPFLPLVLLFLFLPGAAGATPKIGFHVKETQRDPCGSSAPIDVPCSQWVTTANLKTGYTVYLIAAGADPGVQQASLGIAYDGNPGAGLDQFGFTSCNDGLTFPESGPFGEFPAPWSGARFTWMNCQSHVIPGHEEEGVQTIVGSIYVYAYGSDILFATPHPQHPEDPPLWSCEYAELAAPDSAFGRVGFGTSPGFNPCSGAGTWTPVPETPPPPPPPPPPPTPPPPPPPPPPPGPPPSPPALVLHVMHDPHPEEWCGRDVSGAGIVTSEALNPGDNSLVIYLLAVPEGASDVGTFGITGVQLGIQYPGQAMTVQDWHTCSDLEWVGDDWPGPGSSNTITWTIDNCQLGDLIPVGYFNVSASDPSVMSIIPFPPSGLIKVATCKGSEAVVESPVPSSRLGWLSFGGAALGADADGCNPLVESCAAPTPVRSSTWGKLKQLYR